MELAATGAGGLLVGGCSQPPSAQPAEVQLPIAAGATVTTCNMCYVGCSVLAEDRGDRRLRLRGNPASPVNRGKLCAKGNAGAYKARHPERVTRPLIRDGERGSGKWRAVSWEHALSVVATELLRCRTTYGPESIVFWQNVNMERPHLFERFVHALGSPNFISHESSCNESALIGAALGAGPVRTLPDFANAECIVVAGYNALAARDLVKGTRGIMEALDRGATLIVVDPRFSETAAHASPGLWLPIRPGTDGILFAGLGKYLIDNDLYDAAFVADNTFGFDVLKRRLEPYTVDAVCAATDIPKEQFLRAVQKMVGRRTLVDLDRGIAAHRDGTAASYLAFSLNALLGTVDQVGGRQLIPWPPVKLADVAPLVPHPSHARIDLAPSHTPFPLGPTPTNPLSPLGLSQNVPGGILRQDPYPVRALILNAINPVYSLPNGDELVEAMDQLDLVVSIDAFLSESASMADVVLPAAVYLESFELWFPSHWAVSLRQPVLPPLGESRASQDIVIALAKAMGLGEQFPFDSYADYVRAELVGTGITLERLQKEGFVELPYEPGQTLAAGLGTASGKIELASATLAFSGFPSTLEPASPREDPQYPLQLITYKLPFHTQSATGGNPHLASIQYSNPVLVPTSLAAELGISDGDGIVVESRRGSLVGTARLTEGLHPRTVAISHHFGHTAYSKNCAGRGVNANPVISDGTDPVAGNISFNDTQIRLRRQA